MEFHMAPREKPVLEVYVKKEKPLVAKEPEAPVETKKYQRPVQTKEEPELETAHLVIPKVKVSDGLTRSNVRGHHY